MRISKEEIDHIALLARLNLSKEEKKLYGAQLSNILEYIEKLNELDTKNVEPTSHVITLNNVMRDDVLEDSLSREESLKNAPSRSEKFYRVPRIIE